jgi:hypothetical protein
MCAFWKKIGEAVKEIDKIAKEFEETRESSKELPKKEKTTPAEGLDLRKYLSIEEVAQITNLPFDDYSQYIDEEWTGGTYISSNPNIHTYFQVWSAQKDVDGYNPEGVLSYFKEVTPNLLSVKGFGDEAYWSGSNAVLFVRKGQDVLQAVTTSEKGLSLEIMKQLVEKILLKM